MKSFIKPPKKYDSTTSTSDTKYAPVPSNAHSSTFESMTRPSTSNHKFTPASSPKLQQFPQYTPPSNVLSASTTNSPKKLLTPIKNLFTSTKSAGPTPSSNDYLQSLMLNGTSPKESRSSRFKKHIRSRSNASIPIHDFMKPPERLRGEVKLKLTVSSPSLQELDTTNVKSLSSTKQIDTLGENHPLEFVEVPSANISTLGPPILLSRRSSKNISIASLAESENFHTKEVFFDATSMSFINDKDDLRTNHTSYSSGSSDEEYDDDNDEDYEDDDDDDTSSQFSFVQDMKAGRNTSVKYYKTNVDKPKLEQSMILNSFDENDLGHDAEDMMDYDFENNGLGDRDEDYDEYNEFDGENIAYNEMFLDDDLRSHNTSHAYDDKCRGNEIVKDSTTLQTPAPGADPTFGNLSSSFTPETKFREFTSGLEFPLHAPFNSSHHLSIQGPSKVENNDLPSSPGRASIEEDILENYLDPSILNSIQSSDNVHGELESPAIHQENEFELFDVSSPVINGLTIGHNLEHRSKRKGQNSTRSLIHRNPINIPLDQFESCEVSDKDASEEERFIVSFHGSLDDSLNNNIKCKLDDFENWWKLRRTKELNKCTGDNTTKAIPLEPANNQCDTSASAAYFLTEDGDSNRNNTASQISNGHNSSDFNAINNRNRNSVAEMMGLLSTLEQSNRQEVHTEETADPANGKYRNSVAEIMGLLSNLELNHEVGTINKSASEIDNKEVRNSVAGMMNFLASFEENETLASECHDSNDAEPQIASGSTLKNMSLQLESDTLDSNIKRKPSFKRYSWFSSQESLSLKGIDPTDDSLKPPPLDQDILDEINQIPEDYDYDELNKVKRSNSRKDSLVMGFERSSSYSRKPKRVLMLNQAKPNKIETSSKTVTFYDKKKTSSHGIPIDVTRVKSSNLSRGLSFRSVNSIPSVSEVNEEEEDENGDTSAIPVHVKLGRAKD